MTKPKMHTLAYAQLNSKNAWVCIGTPSETKQYNKHPSAGLPGTSKEKTKILKSPGKFWIGGNHFPPYLADVNFV